MNDLTVTQMYYMSFIKHETRLVRLHSSSKISGRFSPILYLVHGTGRHYVICSDPADTEGPFVRLAVHLRLDDRRHALFASIVLTDNIG